jgi:hypothetical protein
MLKDKAYSNNLTLKMMGGRGGKKKEAFRV